MCVATVGYDCVSYLLGQLQGVGERVPFVQTQLVHGHLAGQYDTSTHKKVNLYTSTTER